MMFGSLRKKLNDAWSQGDFWDRQENAVQKQQSMKPAPVRAISQPRQVAPATTQRRVNDSYGTGLTGIVNKTRDVSDANTQADKIRRFATTGLNETYDQEQMRKTNGAYNDPKKRGIIDQVRTNLIGGALDIAKVPPQALKLYGANVKGNDWLGQSMASTNKVLDEKAARTKQPRTDDFAKLTKTRQNQANAIGDKAIAVGGNTEKTIDNKIQQSRFGQRKNDNQLVAGVARGGGQLASQAILGYASGGSSVPSVAMGIQTAAPEYDKARAKGKSNNTAYKIGVAQGGASALSEKIGLDNLMKPTTSLVKSVLSKALSEGTQEGSQQFIQNLIANKTYDPNQGLMDGVGQSALVGGITGGIAAPIFSGINTNSRPTTRLVSNQPSQPDVQMQQRLSAPAPNVNLRPNEANALSDFQDVLTGRVKDVRAINGINQEAYAAARRNGIDLNSGSSADIQNRINQVLEQPQNNRRFFKPLNEGGYIQTPAAGTVKDAFRDILPSRTRPESIRRIVNRGGNPLYHDTTSQGVLGILDSGEISASQAPFSQIAGQGKRVSTTRNFDNYSRYGKSPYRFIIDESKTGQRSVPDNREEFESIFKKSIPASSAETLAIDITNPAVIADMDNGKLEEVIRKAQEKGLKVETFEGKILPNENANVEIQGLTKSKFESLKDKLGIKPLNEGGYAQVPGSKDVDPLESLKQEAKPTNIYDYNPKLLNENRNLRLEQATGQSYADKFGVSPDKEITIYRGVPDTARGKIEAGDWVTADKESARLFARQHKDGSKILTQKAKAGDIRYTADNATGYVDTEFIYKPTQSQPPKSTIVDADEAFRQELRAQGMTVPDDYVQNKPTVTMDNLDLKRLKTDPEYQREVNDSMFAVGQPTKEALMKEYKKAFGNYDKPKLAPQPTKKPTPFEKDLQTAGLAPKRAKGLVVAETKAVDGKKTQRVRTAPGVVEERVVQEPSLQKEEFPTLQEFDKITGGDGSLQKTIETPRVPQDIPERKASNVSFNKDEVRSTARLDETIMRLSEGKVLSEADMNAGKKTRTGLTQGDKGLLRTTSDALGSKLNPTGDGSIQRKLRRTGQYIFGKQFGQDKRMIKATQAFAGDSTYTDSALLDIGKKTYGLLPDNASRERVHAVLDPETAKLGASISETKLSPAEKQAVNTLRELGESINDTSYRMGMISKKKWLENKGGKYIARMYREVEEAPDVVDLLDLPDSKTLFTGMYKSRTEFNDELRKRILRDPVKLAVIRARQVRSNEALDDYMRKADVAGYVSDKPKAGYIKTEYNENLRSWNNKYVRQDVYENINGFKAMSKGVNALNTVLDVYDGNPLRRVRKKLLTIFNPVVRTGNVTSNYFLAYLNGVNPLEYQTGKLWAKKAMKQSNDPLVIAARKSGLTQSNIIRNDKNLFNVDKEFFAGLDKEAYNNTNALKRAGQKTVELKDRATQRYGEADDIAKLAALKAKTDRGVPVAKAIEEVRRGFQDYSRVGHLYDMSAKSPVFGNAFIRFQGDLYMHILKNAAIDHPLRLATLPAVTLLAGNVLSAMSGESKEDKKTREDRLGAPKIPFTDISMEFQTPLGAVDAARFTPLYMRNLLSDGGGEGGIKDEMNRMLPFNIPGSNDKQGWFKAMSSDPLIGPIIQLVSDVDWKGKSIKDPEGYRDGKPLFPDDPLSNKDQNRNRLQYTARSYLPYPLNELGDVAAAFNQNMRNEQSVRGSKNDPSKPDATALGRTGYNTSGSKKTVGQAAARLFGVRAQQFGKDEAAKAREDKKMFSHFDKVDEWKKTLDSTTRAAFESRHKGTQTRKGINEEFAKDPWYKYKNAGELLQNPKLFEAEKKYAEIQNKYDGKPIDPIFGLPKEQRNMVLAKKLKLPGSKDEGFNQLYDQEWYQNFRQEQDRYYKSKTAYAKKRGFKAYESENPYPEAKPEVQKSMDYYFSLPSGTGARSGFIRSNPDVWKAITDQWNAQDVWTDKEREALGLPAIPKDEKKSYSYGGSGRGRGKSGSGSKSKYDYTKDLFSKGSGSSTTRALRKILEEAMSGKTKS